MKNMKKKIREWIKKVFWLYEIDDLRIGGHCGGCGKWIEDVIVPKDWPYSLCSECLDL